MMTVHEQQELPAGYTWGAHWSDPDRGQSGYYIGYVDGSAVKARTVPDRSFLLSEEEFHEAYVDANEGGE